jgi:guanylate kinase
MADSLESKLAAYRPSAEAIHIVQNTKILFLVGVSGAGKDTIKHQLLQKDMYHHIVSHTTRKPRFNHGDLEKDGIDYHFVDIPAAEKMLHDHAFIEAKIYSGNIYGTSLAEVKRAHDEGHIAITDLEVQGVVEYKQMAPRVMAVFILPPSFSVWQARIGQRYAGQSIDSRDRARRLRTAYVELKHALETNYFHFVINDNLADAVEQVDHIAHHQIAPTQETRAHTLALTLLDELKHTLSTLDD